MFLALGIENHCHQTTAMSDAILRRRGPGLAASTVDSVPTARATLHSLPAETKSVLHWDDLPAWRRDNIFLLTSYRHPTPSVVAILKSTLSLHNETVNIWTHLLGACLFLGMSLWAFIYVRPRYMPSVNGADVVVFSTFFAGAVACLGMSATYHATSSHSEQVARIGNKLDYGGIVLLIVGSFIPAFYYGLFCHKHLMVPYMTMVLCTTH